MKSLVFAAVLVGVALNGPTAAAEQVSKETAERIEKVLAEIGCKPGEIEAGKKGYEVDDASCADGQYDIKLDKDFQVTSRRKE